MPNPITRLFAPSDEQLMWRVKLQDDAQAFASLMTRWQRPIQRLCTRMTGDPHRAEDLTQTVFARVFARREEWEPQGKLSTFLWRIALNLCHDEARRNRRRGETSLEAMQEMGDWLEFVETDEPQPDANVEHFERADFVRAALQKLAPHYREVVVLRHYEQLKFREIGNVLGIAEGTVKSRMAEALTQLNKLLKHLQQDISCNPKTQTPELLAL